MNQADVMDRRTCSWHGEREASAACHVCARPLCRECALESGGRIVCRICAEAPMPGKRAVQRGASAWTRAPYAALGLAALWAVFYLFLQWVASRPGQYLLH